MGGFSNKQLKAISWYSNEKGYKLMLSSYPSVSFKTHKGEVKVSIQEIVLRHEQNKKAESRGR